LDGELVGLAGDRRMSEAPESLPWFRLHRWTWTLVFLVGWALVAENWTGQHKNVIIDFQGHVAEVLGPRDRNPYDPSFRPVFKGMGKTAYIGWPFTYIGLVDYNYKPVKFNLILFTLNILISLAILFSTAFTTESYVRRQAQWHQFSIQDILAFTTFVALLLANAKYDFVRCRGDWTYYPIAFFFIAMGLWCVFWTAWKLIGLGVGRIGVGLRDG